MALLNSYFNNHDCLLGSPNFYLGRKLGLTRGGCWGGWKEVRKQKRDKRAAFLSFSSSASWVRRSCFASLHVSPASFPSSREGERASEREREREEREREGEREREREEPEGGRQEQAAGARGGGRRARSSSPGGGQPGAPPAPARHGPQRRSRARTQAMPS